MIKPLQDSVVIDFTQFLSGPSASLRLQDLGARVIKIEHHEKGDLSRSIYASHLNIAGDSAFFQAINRGKESLAANLKNEQDLELIHRIIKSVDILVHNFRPGVMQRFGLDYAASLKLNPNIIYGEITGYGSEGPWSNKPGQDLLLQALSGLTSLSGGDSDGPVPMGLAIADNFAGAQLVQGLLAALYGGETAHIEISMLEAILDFQLEPLTLFYQDGELPKRGEVNPAHSLVAAPYGLYRTADGYLALAMGSIPQLGKLLNCEPLLQFTDSARWFAERDSIKSILAKHLITQTSQYWLAILQPADIWCANVLDWQQLIADEGFKVLDMLQSVSHPNGASYKTTRCPIRLNDQLLTSQLAAPLHGEHSEALRAEFQSDE